MNNRLSLITIAAWAGIVGNLILAVLKIIIGITSESLAVIGDGIDSTTDILSFLIILFATQIIAKEPDKTHPYGHHRAEPIATIIISFIIFFIGAQLLQFSVQKLVAAKPVELPSITAIYITIISIVGKIILAFTQFSIGKKTSSQMLIANGKNMLNDIFISLGILIGLAFAFWFNTPILDPIFALIISLWVLITAIKIFLETNTELMEGYEDTSIYNQIFEAVSKVAGAHNPHRTRIRKLASLLVIDIDIEVDRDLTVEKGHAIAVEVENAIKAVLDNVYDVSVHIEPLGNEEHGEKYGVCGKKI
ncbi:MAG TPA: cation diffusion facilitator family transporter [Bacillota bacterium]|jgi:cation diffusion facilitator family transporter|nr:cation diffusion facilitator family transporter [Bacillota bacterium]HOL09049.1 cation diffusion facilitator family transporter [Bacillota bacterium]HPO96724.1 cation diffusion facilitator family transporter [Bacillota bacterium]